MSDPEPTRVAPARIVVEFPPPTGYRGVGSARARRARRPASSFRSTASTICCSPSRASSCRSSPANRARWRRRRRVRGLRVRVGPFAARTAGRCRRWRASSPARRRRVRAGSRGRRRGRVDRARDRRRPPGRMARWRPKDVDFFALLEAYRAGDESARDQIVEQYMPLVRKHRRRATRAAASRMEDLVQVGSIGLVLAIERFDIERGVQFTTYAVPTIVGEIQRHFRDRAWAVHVPRRMKELEPQARPARSRRRRPTSAARRRSRSSPRRPGSTEDEVVEALETYHAYSTRSLSQPLGRRLGEDETMQDLLGARGAGYDEVEDGVLVEAGLAALDERERAHRRAAVLRGTDAVGDRRARRHLADARLAAAAPRARRDARPARGQRSQERRAGERDASR